MNRLNPESRVLTRLLSAAVAIALPCLVSAQAQDDQSVDARLKSQEQRIQELEKRLAEKESAAMSGTPASGPAASGAEPAAMPAAEDSPETRESHQLMTGQELASADFPGSWPMFGSDMRMKVGGYVKADVLYDLDGSRDKYQFLMSTIPVPGSPDYGNSGYLAMFARETRFGIDVRRNTPGAPPLRMFLEADFWSTGNQFRLRHAYMVAGKFLIGQTWTTLSFLESLPFMIDFAAGDALFGGRTTQVRYQTELGDRWKFAVAAESLDFPGIENPNGLPGQPSTQAPVLAVRADYHLPHGVLLMGASVAQLRWDGGATGPTDKALQADVVFAGRQYVGDKNYFTWNISYGDGAGENIMAFTGSKANAVLDASGKLDTMRSTATVLGYWHKWSDKWSTNVSYAYGALDTPPSRAPLALKRGGVTHVNWIWRPVKQFTSGIELMWGEQRVQNDALGKASRVQLMAKYEF